MRSYHASLMLWFTTASGTPHFCECIPISHAAWPDVQARLVPTAAPALVAPMLLIANPRGHVKQLHSSLRRLLSVLHAIRRKLGDAHTLYHGESLFLLYLRWSKLTRELHRPRRDEDAYEIVSDTWSCRTDPSLLARCPESTLHALRLPRAMPFVCAV